MIVVAHGVSDAPLLVKTSNGALCPGAPLVFLEKKLLVVAHHGCGAPHGAPLVFLEKRNKIVSSGAP